MRRNWLRFVLAISLALNFSFLFTVGYMHFKQKQYWTTPFGGKIEKDRFLFEELSLQPEQREKMKQRALSFRSQVDGKRKAIAEKRKELFTLIRTDQSEAPTMDAVINELSSMQADLQKTIVLHILGTKDLLDEEQQKRLFDLMENTMHSGGQIECLPQDRH
jgi:Spy/CpxP family protein refolding chaperone